MRNFKILESPEVIKESIRLKRCVYNNVHYNDSYPLSVISTITALENYIKSLKMDIDKKVLLAHKLAHTYRVAHLMLEYAIKYELSQRELALYAIVGLLHDFGRIEEIMRTGNFAGISINHAQIGVEQLFDNGIGNPNSLIRQFVKTPDYDKAIYYAILFHNVLNLQKAVFESKQTFSFSERKMFARLRSADKQDIMNFLTFTPTKTTIGVSEDELAKSLITSSTLREFTNHNFKRYGGEEDYTDIRHWLSHYSFVFDPSNTRELLEWVKKSNWLHLYSKSIAFTEPDTVNKIAEIQKICSDFVENRLAAGMYE